MGHADYVCKNLIELAQGRAGRHEFSPKSELVTIVALGGKLGGAVLGGPKFLGAHAHARPPVVLRAGAHACRAAHPRLTAPPSLWRAPRPRVALRRGAARRREQST
jgi:hypothetical protein